MMLSDTVLFRAQIHQQSELFSNQVKIHLYILKVLISIVSLDKSQNISILLVHH